MEGNSPDLAEIQGTGQRSASSHVVDEQLGGYDAGSNLEQGIAAVEKTEEQ